MDEYSSNDRRDATEAEATASKTTESNDRLTNLKTELVLLNRTLKQLEVKLLYYGKRIDDNLKRRNDIIQDVCRLITILEKPLYVYDRAQQASREFEETLGVGCSDSEDGEIETDRDRERRRLHEEIRELREDATRAEQQVQVVRKLCVYIEPLFTRQRIDNETIHAILWEKFVKIVEARRETMTRREQLMTTIGELIKNDK